MTVTDLNEVPDVEEIELVSVRLILQESVEDCPSERLTALVLRTMGQHAGGSVAQLHRME